jgi:hypothetical protein
LSLCVFEKAKRFFKLSNVNSSEKFSAEMEEHLEHLAEPDEHDGHRDEGRPHHDPLVQVLGALPALKMWPDVVFPLET